MAEQISRAVYHTTLNLLRLLAERGDPDAVLALKNMEETDFDVIDDGEANIQVVVQSARAEYLVTEHGTLKVALGNNDDKWQFFNEEDLPQE